MDAFRAGFALGRFAHQGDLLRQIHDGNFDFGVVADALFRPAAGVAADVEQLFNRFGEHGFQGFGKGIVGIIVVEGKPFFLRDARQRRQAFVNCWPTTKNFQPFGFARLQGFFQVEHTLVTDFLREIHVHARHFVFQ